MGQCVTGGATAYGRAQSTLALCKPSPRESLHRGIADQSRVELRPADAALLSKDIANGIPLAVVAASVQEMRVADVCAVKTATRGSKCDQHPQPRVHDRLATASGTASAGSRNSRIASSWVNSNRVEPRAVWECNSSVPIFENEEGSSTTPKRNTINRSSSRSYPDLTMARKGIFSAPVKFS